MDIREQLAVSAKCPDFALNIGRAGRHSPLPAIFHWWLTVNPGHIELFSPLVSSWQLWSLRVQEWILPEPPVEGLLLSLPCRETISFGDLSNHIPPPTQGPWTPKSVCSLPHPTFSLLWPVSWFSVLWLFSQAGAGEAFGRGWGKPDHGGCLLQPLLLLFRVVSVSSLPWGPFDKSPLSLTCLDVHLPQEEVVGCSQLCPGTGSPHPLSGTTEDSSWELSIWC